MIRISSFSGRRVAVFGLARSGIAAARALAAGGCDVACWDDGEAGRAAAAREGLAVVDLRGADWSGFSALVLAPGVPLSHPQPHWTVIAAKSAGIEVIGDTELFFRERAAVLPATAVVAVTGTNGKSTTTALIAHLLRKAGADVEMGGNIGVGVLALAPFAPGRVYVIEMSSFQIDLTPGLNPSVGVVLNVAPDHLDRHGTLERYAAIKRRMAAQADRAVIGLDDAWCRRFANELAASGKSVRTISAGRDADVWCDGHAVVSRAPEARIDLGEIATLRGAHNAQNAAAALAAVSSLGINPAEVANAFASFTGLPHRMEEIGRIGRVLVINDSKATNADSTEKALATFAGGIHWIVGGMPKEGGITSLGPYFDRITKAYLIGMCAPDFAKTLEGKVPYEMCGTLDVALRSAARDALGSDAEAPVVLLSPACASYDQFKSFEHRGDRFRELALGLQDFVPTRVAP
jgi:UDP-N-acetylmuramoylalanine--D-glutamate ligase